MFGIEEGEPIVASPATNRLMVWTVEALELLEIYEFVTNGSIELKKKN